MQEKKALSSRGRGRLRGFLELRRPWGLSSRDAGLLEPPERPQGSPASSSVRPPKVPRHGGVPRGEDWASQGQPKGKAEIPVVPPEKPTQVLQLGKTTEIREPLVRRQGSQVSMRVARAFSCIGEGNGNPLQCSCLENPRDGGAWWVAVSGVAQSRTRLK